MSLNQSVADWPKAQLDTPALIVDLDKMERNIARMSRTIIEEARLQWRPHMKCPKIPAIAHQMISAGAIGVTCAKLGEAEVMANAGIRDILIANQVVGAQKVARLTNLLRHADVIVSVDSEVNVAELDRAALAKHVRLRTVIEVDVGMNRAGVQPGDPVVSLASKIAHCDGLEFAGLMTFEAHALDFSDAEEKRQAIEKALGTLVSSANLCRQNDLPVEIVSCGGTGTYQISVKSRGITELQAGGGIFSDIHYCRDYGVDHELALSVLATVTSRPNSTRIICDSGRKAMSIYGALPEPVGIDGVKLVAVNAEHAIIELERPNERIQIGDKVEFSVGHSDFTVHLHDELYGVRDGKVEVVWPIAARAQFR